MFSNGKRRVLNCSYNLWCKTKNLYLKRQTKVALNVGMLTLSSVYFSSIHCQSPPLYTWCDIKAFHSRNQCWNPIKTFRSQATHDLFLWGMAVSCNDFWGRSVALIYTFHEDRCNFQPSWSEFFLTTAEIVILLSYTHVLLMHSGLLGAWLFLPSPPSFFFPLISSHFFSLKKVQLLSINQQKTELEGILWELHSSSSLPTEIQLYLTLHMRKRRRGQRSCQSANYFWLGSD